MLMLITYTKAGEWLNLADCLTSPKGGMGLWPTTCVSLLVTITKTATKPDANTKNLSTTSATGKLSFSTAGGGPAAIFSGSVAMDDAMDMCNCVLCVCVFYQSWSLIMSKIS